MLYKLQVASLKLSNVKTSGSPVFQTPTNHITQFRKPKCPGRISGSTSSIRYFDHLKNQPGSYIIFTYPKGALPLQINHVWELFEHIWRFPKMGVARMAGWFIMENKKTKWMITRGTPIYRNPHIMVLKMWDSMVISYPPWPRPRGFVVKILWLIAARPPKESVWPQRFPFSEHQQATTDLVTRVSDMANYQRIGCVNSNKI